MPDPRSTPRFFVSNIGYAFAVHDRATKAHYAFPAGREKKHLSSNEHNTKIVEVVATRAEAQRLADALNRAHAGDAGAA
jgi:hypothetical protein